MEKYDVFISYRRTGFDTANLIATHLRSAGYRVFFDTDTLRSGKFNEQLFEVIDRCTDFLLVLPEGALDRCVDPEDWVRQEVQRAMQKNKNIIPIMLTGFEWPSPMPDGMEGLQYYQSISATSNEFFDLAIKRLCDKYLKSKSSRRKAWLRAGKIALVAVAVMAVLYAALYAYSTPLCGKITPVLMRHLVLIDHYGFNSLQLFDEWNASAAQIQQSENPFLQQRLKSDIKQKIDYYLSQAQFEKTFDETPQDISLIDNFALMVRGINPLELLVEPSYATDVFNDLTHNIEYLSACTDSASFNTFIQRHVAYVKEMTVHTLNATYYAYLDVLSSFPKSVRDDLEVVAKDFRAFSSGIPVNLNSSEYRKRQETEMNMVENILFAMENDIETADNDVQDINKRLSEIENLINTNKK